ncbi:hypothetical protein HNQ94_000063 [Salirhabdus euzebyi]|uniref:YrhK domain-containing protein n=1 Tax=Salirhabdus euzebyi TaxID=394506 RepID=A0A841Q168_9BACI|nr:hypothetical protein [Salirhabdus euzebyi]
MNKFNIEKKPDYMDIKIGQHEIIIDERYEFIYNLNDVFIALFFLIGSILFLWDSLEIYAIWMFIVGSALFLLRPLIQFIKRFHLKNVRKKRF